MGGWGCKYLPVSKELGIRAKLLAEGGPKMWEQFMTELRELHLGQRLPAKSNRITVAAKLEAAYEAVVASQKSDSKRASQA
jgi:hypothetical protein